VGCVLCIRDRVSGGAIKGNRIDVLVGSDGSADSWGRKYVKVKVIK
ncbi:3D domain-containing protein, partial [Bacillus sp. 'calajunan']